MMWFRRLPSGQRRYTVYPLAPIAFLLGGLAVWWAC